MVKLNCSYHEPVSDFEMPPNQLQSPPPSQHTRKDSRAVGQQARGVLAALRRRERLRVAASNR